MKNILVFVPLSLVMALHKEGDFSLLPHSTGHNILHFLTVMRTRLHLPWPITRSKSVQPWHRPWYLTNLVMRKDSTRLIFRKFSLQIV